MTKQLTDAQRDELIKQYVEIVVDNMSTESLVDYAQEQMEEYHEKLSDNELIEYIDCYDPELYDELVDNVTTNSKELIYTDEQKRLTTLEELEDILVNEFGYD